jgi:hypothetical protein
MMRVPASCMYSRNAKYVRPGSMVYECHMLENMCHLRGISLSCFLGFLPRLALSVP